MEMGAGDYQPLEVEEPRRKSAWKDTAMRLAPYIGIGVVVVAVAIALIARDVSRANDVATMNSKLTDLEAALTVATKAYEAKMAETEAAMKQTQVAVARDTEVSHSVATSLRKFVPHACKLECMNGGKPDEMCMTCTGCDAGFGGRWCHVPESCANQCDLDTKQCSCRRGGSLDPSTCKCVCPVGWTGERCTIPTPGATLEDRRGFLDHLFQQSQQRFHQIEEQRKRAALYGEALIPTHLGNGASSLTRTLKLAVLEPAYPTDLANARRFVSPFSGNNYLIPERVFFELSSNTGPVMRSETFNDMKDYVAYLNDLRSSGNQVGSTLFLKSIQDMVDLFRSYPDSFITHTQQIRALYTLKFDVSSTAGYESFRLEDNCARALDYLPNTYDENSKELYNQFLDYWGDSFVVESTEGGYVESIHALHKEYCTAAGRATNAHISQMQRSFMGKFYGLPGTWTVTNTYEAHAARDAGGCSGGNVVMCEEQLKSKVDYTPWTNTVWDFPAAVSMKLRPMTDMVRDPTKKAALQAAIDARNAETTAPYISYTGRVSEMCPGSSMPRRPADWYPIYGRPREGRFGWRPRSNIRYFEP